jgi:hypothetical protein
MRAYALDGDQKKADKWRYLMRITEPTSLLFYGGAFAFDGGSSSPNIIVKITNPDVRKIGNIVN